MRFDLEPLRMLSIRQAQWVAALYKFMVVISKNSCGGELGEFVDWASMERVRYGAIRLGAAVRQMRPPSSSILTLRRAVRVRDFCAAANEGASPKGISPWTD